MNYKKFSKFFSKKFFVWLGLFLGTGCIVYLFSFFREGSPFFGSPFPFYYFGGCMMGIFLPPSFNYFSFIIDAIFWYSVSIQTSYIKFLKPTKKKIFLWLGLFFGIGYIAYFFLTPREGPPSFGFPFPFYCFGGPAMIGGFVPPSFDFSFFINDTIFWYIISCLIIED